MLGLEEGGVVTPDPGERVAARRIRIDPDPLEQYRIAPGYVVGDLVFLSGMAALDERGRMVGGNDFEAQAHHTFDALDRVLRAAGSSLERVIKATIYVTDMANFPKVVELRERWGRPYPADTIVEVSSLALAGLLLEIDVIAFTGSGRIEG